MTTAITSQVSRFNLIYIIVTMLAFYAFAMMFIKDTDSFRQGVEQELTYILEKVPSKEAEYLQSVTTFRYQRWLHQSGVFAEMRRMFMPKQIDYMEDMSKGVLSRDWNVRFLNNMQYMFYQFVMRLTLLEFWLYTMLPMSIAIVMTGYFNWKKKLYQLGGHSVNVVRLWLKIGWLFLLLLCSYLVVPSFAGVYALYAPPVLMVVLAFTISKVIESFHKSF